MEGYGAVGSHRRSVWISLCLLGGLGLLLLGWILGNWMACTGEECSFDTELFAGLGTWVGGIGTVVALVFAALQLSADFEERARTRHADEMRRREELQGAIEEAQHVTMTAGMNGFVGEETGTLVSGTIVNGANEKAIFNVKATVPGYGDIMVPKIEPKGHTNRS